MSIKSAKKPITIADKIDELFETHIDVTGAILDDYIADPGMITELAAADENLRDGIENLFEKEEDSFEGLIKKLKAMDSGEIEPSELLELLDFDDIREYVEIEGAQKDLLMVRIKSMKHQEMLREFIETEIYPDYKDQRENILF